MNNLTKKLRALINTGENVSTVDKNGNNGIIIDGTFYRYDIDIDQSYEVNEYIISYVDSLYIYDDTKEDFIRSSLSRCWCYYHPADIKIYRNLIIVSDSDDELDTYYVDLVKRATYNLYRADVNNIFWRKTLSPANVVICYNEIDWISTNEKCEQPTKQLGEIDTDCRKFDVWSTIQSVLDIYAEARMPKFDRCGALCDITIKFSYS